MIRSGVSRVRESSDRLGRRLAASPVFSAETYARIVNPAPAELDSALPRRSQSEAPSPWRAFERALEQTHHRRRPREE